ncbi:MAG: right-handed parallel beta-helix repeat-containing protein, partial [Chitinophagaceae bacterium]|nr:right-handed parallel beta-helix repeat-containing protein [Chitinophagaceae bacterium]
MKKIIIAIVSILLASSSFAQEFYVSPSGSDKNQGSLQKPFASLEKAKEAVKAINKGNRTITVYLREGIYYLPQAFKLNKEDGGTAANPIIYTAYKNEKVQLRGSHIVPNNSIKKITDLATLQRIDPKLKDSIIEIDLGSLNYKNIKRFADKFNDDGGIIELFMNDERMKLSRYPNEGNMTMKKVLINGGGQEVKNEDWRNFYADGAKEQKVPRPGVFEYRDDRTANWVNALERGVWLKGYWRIPWQNEAVRIAKIDTAAKTITLAVPVSGGIGNKYTRPEGNGKEPYWLLNLLEEIDRPGEWAIDFKDKKLYFYPPANITANSLRIADNSEPLIQLNNASNVQIKNITIEENLHDGIKIFNGENNLIAGCTIRNVTKNGITVDSGKGHTILSNDIYYTGAGGVWLKGGDEKTEPKISSEFKVVNNHIHHYGVIQKIYAAAINAGFSGGG